MSGLAHAWIISSPAAEERERDAFRLAAAMVCVRGESPACGLCRHCRKAREGIHPDVIRVERETNKDGKLRREITVNQIRALTADAFVLPNEAGRKVYWIPEADLMNESAQNAFLKLLEEPPAHAAFLLCAKNPAALLPTVRSRCVMAQPGREEEAFPPEAMAGAERLLQTAAIGNRAELLRCCTALSELDTGAATALFACAGNLTAQMLCLRRDRMGMPAERVARLHGLFGEAVRRLRVNANVKQMFGLVAVSAWK